MRLALAALVVAALAVPAAGSSAPVAGGTTVVAAGRSGYVDLVVPRDARLSPAYRNNPDVSVSGPGRMLGVWLEGLDGPGDQLEVMRMPAFLGSRTHTVGTTEPAPDCSPGASLGSSCTAPKPTAIVLHRGRYRLTVLTDGRPVRFVLHLHGLAGRSVLRPVRFVLHLHGLAGRSVLRPAHVLASAERPLQVRETLGDRMVTYGGTGPVSGTVRSWVAATATTSGTQLDGWTLCERHDPAETAPFAYSPACPGDTSGQYDLAVRDGTYGVYGTWAAVESTGPVGLGGSFINDGGVRLGKTLGVWLAVP